MPAIGVGFIEHAVDRPNVRMPGRRLRSGQSFVCHRFADGFTGQVGRIRWSRIVAGRFQCTSAVSSGCGEGKSGHSTDIIDCNDLHRMIG